jgi:hypothetical protein
MPLRPKKGLSRKLKNGHKTKLLHGIYLTGDERFEDEKQIKRAWKIHGPTLMKEWLSDSRNSGTRPWAFWQFEGLDKPDGEDEFYFLRENGLLFEGEEAKRREYEKRFLEWDD